MPTLGPAARPPGLARLVFIDESAAQTNRTRLYGRASGGEHLLAKCSAGHWCTTTMISSIRLDGTTECLTVEGATDADVFHAHVRTTLCPVLRPGDLVILDNLTAHKNAHTLARIEAVGAESGSCPPTRPTSIPSS